MTLGDLLYSWKVEDLQADMQRGGKFIIYTYTISILVMTFKRPSDLYYIPSSGNAISHGWKYLLLSFFLGWWGFPWGPIYTCQSIWYAFTGIDVTDEVADDIMQHMRVGNPVDYNTELLMQ